MAYTVVLENPNAPPAFRWRWYVAKAMGFRTEQLLQGAASSREIAAEESDLAMKGLRRV